MNYRKTEVIRARSGRYQATNRIDLLTHEKLKFIRAFYRDAMNAEVKRGVIVRRALALLTEHIDILIEQRKEGEFSMIHTEKHLLNLCADGSYSEQLQDPLSLPEFPSFKELQKMKPKHYDDSEYLSIND